MAVTWGSALDLIKKLAPSLGTALGGPLAGSAITAIENALGMAPQDRPATMEERQTAIAAVIEGATPEQLAAVRKADQDYQVKMTELGFKSAADLASISAQDRADARSTAVKTGSLTPTILAYLVVGMVIMGEGFMLLYGSPKSVDGVIVGRILGTLDSALILVLQFYYGSTASSQHANELLAASTPVGSPATGGEFKS